MPWFRRHREYRAQEFSIGDPALVEWFGLGGSNAAGMPVTEASCVGLTAVYRAVALVSGTVAGLPLKSYRTVDDTRQRVTSVLDNPDGADGMTPFEWVELVMVHLLLWGNAYLLHEYGGAGQLLALHPIHPSAVTVKRPATEEEQARFGEFRKFFTVDLADGTQRVFTPQDLTHIPARPVPMACRWASMGERPRRPSVPMAGLVSGDEDMTQEDAQAALDGIKAKVSGSDHAGDIAFINAKLKFTPWSMPANDAQFIESRVHQVEEVARIFGVPPHLLMQTEKSTSWGTGIAEQNRGLARYTLMSWTSRIEQRLSRLLPTPRFGEFDYSGLLQGAPEVEIPLLLAQLQAGAITLDEYRRIRNMAPLAAGTAPSPSPAPPAPELEEVPA